MENTFRVVKVNGKEYRVQFFEGEASSVVGVYRRGLERALVQRVLWDAHARKPTQPSKLIARIIQAAQQESFNKWLARTLEALNLIARERGSGTRPGVNVGDLRDTWRCGFTPEDAALQAWEEEGWRR